MRQYPIWNDINTRGGRESSSNFGVRYGYVQVVRVGTSSRNSHQFAKIEVHQRPVGDSGRVEFLLTVDDVMVKRGTLDGSEFSIDIDGVNQAN